MGYDIYGIGNALVDNEIEVSEDDLQTRQIDKGLMTLIEQDRLFELLESFEHKKQKWACGGSAANTIIGATQMGLKSYYSCRVNNDKSGTFYINDLKKNNVDTNQLHSDTLHTGTCLVMVTPDADRTMNTFLGISSTLNENDVNEDAIKSSKIVYIEGYLVASEHGKAAAIKTRQLAEKHHVKTAFTLSDPNMVEFFRDGLVQIIGTKVDVLFCNEDEALKFAQTESLEDAKKMLINYGNTVVITLGQNGATIYDGDAWITVAPYTVKAIDTNGAGDSFAGVFLAAMIQGEPLNIAGQLASYASSRVVSKFGPRLETLDIEAVQNTFRTLTS